MTYAMFLNPPHPSPLPQGGEDFSLPSGRGGGFRVRAI